ncbi:3-hydroxyacyl-ACP dehydratase [Vibrio sp. HA2012]|uniref:ApeI family dehydratase n=1 Tax=Vibrio sp. HA2012 TaxID=1971595 RepID=UPI000C2BF173|nr:3-hydroxyacyl-ACP dehydratase [Vibrio sp. HA2012]PJC85795.1 3-hydroxyacyl-ACP dehydratase [Vibrio sp. HA2012]
MQKRKPTIISQTSDEQTAELVLGVDADIRDFEGHFTSFPLLPGVTQIDWVMYFARLTLHMDQEFAGMEVIKFQEPIFPGATVTLALDWDKARSKLQFKYSSDNGNSVHSSGKIKLSGDK